MSTERIDRHSYVVLGATGGIGSQVAKELRSSSNNVLLASRDQQRLDLLATELDCPTFQLDATNIDEVEQCFSFAADQFGGIAGAVNCAGSILLKPAHLTSNTEWSETISANLTSAFATVRAAAKIMAKAGGSVVLMSSAAARIGLANHEAIAAAKAGIIGLARSAAASYASQGLRFNVVAPGLVKTNLTKRIWESERASATSEAMHALGRLGEPDDVASLICWLLDPANSWTTGEVFSIDGGLANVSLNRRPGTATKK